MPSDTVWSLRPDSELEAELIDYAEEHGHLDDDGEPIKTEVLRNVLRRGVEAGDDDPDTWSEHVARDYRLVREVLYWVALGFFASALLGAVALRFPELATWAPLSSPWTVGQVLGAVLLVFFGAGLPGTVAAGALYVLYRSGVPDRLEPHYRRLRGRLGDVVNGTDVVAE